MHGHRLRRTVSGLPPPPRVRLPTTLFFAWSVCLIPVALAAYVTGGIGAGAEAMFAQRPRKE